MFCHCCLAVRNGKVFGMSTSTEGIVMGISDATVEAAAWEMFQQEYPATWAKELGELDKPLRDTYLNAAREVLESVGEQAFEQAAVAGWKALLNDARRTEAG